MHYLKFIVLFVLVVSACSKSGKEPAASDTVAVSAKQQIEFTADQVKLAEIETGKIEKRVLSDYIECTGTIEAPNQSMVTVTAPMGGIIRQNKLLPGIFVEKGTLLAVLENPEYTTIQQEFLQAQSSLEYYGEEFKRQGELTLENAASLKKMQLSQADYKGVEAKYNALKKQLQFIGIDPEKLTANNITSTISIYATIAGHLTRVEGNSGKYVSPFDMVCEIVDKSHLHLSLSLYEKDIMKVRKGQMVKFSVISNEQEEFLATVEIIGQALTGPNRGIPVHAHIEGNSSGFIPGMYVNAKVFLTDNNSYCVPHSAIVKHGSNAYIFMANKNQFTRIPVKTGIEQNNYIQLISPDIKLLDAIIVVHGAYYIETEWNKSTE